MEKKKERIHFIGIGGISMSTLAAIALKQGHTVTGSDLADTELTRRLERAGVKIFHEQKAGNIGDVDRVVYTAAISENNPEFVEAKRRGIPMIRRSAYLGEVMKTYPVRIGVSGTHGKSSTTGMLSSLFISAGKDPTVACGAVLTLLDGAYRLGEGGHFIYEACEYKDSFLDFYPTIALMLNIEMDHVDYFKSYKQLLDSFARSAKDAQAAVVNWDDENVRKVCEKMPGVWVVRTGVDREDVDYRAVNVEVKNGFASFDWMKENELMGRIELRVPGVHHVRNALCAAAAAHICSLDPDAISRGISEYTGIKRRFEFIGEYAGARIYDDYAHHPTEIMATLRAARQVKGENGRLIVVFQPHTYSRTKGLFDDFVSVLTAADKLYLAPIYAAREKDTYGVSSEDLAKKIPGAVTFTYFDEAVQMLRGELRPGDLLLTLGAGNADAVGRMLVGDGRL